MFLYEMILKQSLGVKSQIASSDTNPTSWMKPHFMMEAVILCSIEHVGVETFFKFTDVGA
jgi:hypothetical protein